ncbi:hypothetical protein NOVOSPHI9U_70011 [Novosphingobium sp. 9U]|nr:hypothetical protein NOVOSPHI9U_70011 [Novosphingobium sp. 9U]
MWAPSLTNEQALPQPLPHAGGEIEDPRLKRGTFDYGTALRTRDPCPPRPFGRGPHGRDPRHRG